MDTEIKALQEHTPLSKPAQTFLNCVSFLSVAITFLVVRRDFDTDVAAGFLAVFAMHELGHVAVATYHGMPSTWPIFIPNAGAFVLTLRPFKDSCEEAHIALGGPVAGLLATAVLHGIGFWLESMALLELAVFCYGIHLVNMIPAGMLDGGRIAGHVFKPLWVPGLLGLVWVAYKFSSDGWSEILISVLVLWPAARRALSILKERRLGTGCESAPDHRSDVCQVAAIALGVIAFGTVGLMAALRHQQDLAEGFFLTTFIGDPPSFSFPAAPVAAER